MRGRSRATGLLLEIIMTLLFFSIACAMLVQIFVYTKSVAIESDDKTRALICAQNIAEHFSAEAPMEGQADVTQPGAYTIYFDNDMVPCDEADSVFTALVDVSSYLYGVGDMDTALISVSKNGSPLIEITVDKYKGGVAQ